MPRPGLRETFQETMQNRCDKLALLQGSFDVLVIGGGATGLGIAVDAQSRGFSTALVEAADFAQATSSRATKLVHGGVRYLASGQINLVYEALRERKVMMTNAPHLVHPLPFLTPAYKWFDLPYYGVALKLYDLLSGKSSMGPTQLLSVKETLQRIPGIATSGLKGGVLYHDGQFDDARFALALARTAEDNGALILNYLRCTQFLKENGKVVGALLEDAQTAEQYSVRAKAVINATGIFVDSIRRQDDPAKPQLLSVSRGTHIVVESDALGGNTAIMVPKTDDGRVVFAIPWLGKVIIGTTDLPAREIAVEPGHEESEIDFLLETINPFLARTLSRSDILSVFSGLRPLVTGSAATTAKLSREHYIDISESGLVTIAGGKWTTYRRMSEDTIDFAIDKGLLPRRNCISQTIRLHGAPQNIPHGDPLSRYGTDAIHVRALTEKQPALAAKLDPSLPFTLAEVIYAAREEMALTVEDVLSRRTRALLLDARAAERAAPAVAELMAKELGHGDDWVRHQAESFHALAKTFYELSPPSC
jgi:glycerol-3-phosphate dehydrogenase